MATKALTFEIFGRDKSASKTLKGVGKSADGVGGSLKALAKLASSAFVVKQIVDFGTDSVKAFQESELAQTKLQDAFKRFPKLADVNIGSLTKLNQQLALKTKFDDDATASGQAVLATFGLTGKQLEKMTPLLQDYAAKTGQDLPSAAKNLGLAMMGNTRAMKTVGINFKATGDRGKDFDTIMTGLTKKVGGFATKEGTTAAGKMEILRNRFGEIQETIGSALMPILSDLASFLNTHVAPAIESFAAWFKTQGIPALKSFGGWLKQNGKWLGIVAGFVLTAVAAFKTYAVIMGVVRTATAIWTAVQIGLNIALTANPIGLVIVAIGALVAAIVWIATKTTFFQDAWKWMCKVVQNAWQWLWKNVIKPVADWIVDKFNTLVRFGKILSLAIGLMVKQIGANFDRFKRFVGNAIIGAIKWFQELPKRILRTLSGAVGWLKATGRNIITGLINGVKDAAKNVWRTIKNVANSIINGVKSFFGIKSPSTVFTKIGGQLMAGLFRGIFNSKSKLGGIFGKVFGDVKKNVTGAIGALAGAGANIWESIFGGSKADFEGGSSRRGGAGGAAQWASLVSKVLAMLGQSQSNLPAVLRRINMESGGNPKAINLWDSNFKAGIPSKGLMQTIDPTFNAYAGPFRGLGVYNPLANIYAGLNYAIKRYGSIRAIDPLVRPIGYASGGSVHRTGSYMVGEQGPEMVTLPGGAYVTPNHRLGGSGGQINVIIQSKGGIDLSKYIEVKIEQADQAHARRIRQG